MNIEIVQASFCEAKEYCERKTGGSLFFELSYMDSDEKAMVEFNRFNQEINSGDILGADAVKNVILNLSAWNDSYLYNKYLESFLYMLRDMQDELNYKIVLEKEINNHLHNKIKKLGLFEFSLTALSTMEKKNGTVKMGFYDNSQLKGGDRNV